MQRALDNATATAANHRKMSTAENCTPLELAEKLDKALNENDMLTRQVKRLEMVSSHLRDGLLGNMESKVQNAIQVCDDVANKLQEQMKQLVILQKCAEMATNLKYSLEHLLPSLTELAKSVGECDDGPDGIKQYQNAITENAGAAGRRKKFSGKASIYTAPEPEILCIFPLFQEFPLHILQKLSSFSYELRRKAGDTILMKGDMSHEIFFVVEGAVSILNGKNQEISTLNVGSFFGELGFLFSCRRTASVIANKDCILIVLTIQKLHEALSHHPDYIAKLHEFENQRKAWYSKQNYALDDDFGGEFMSSIARHNIAKMGIFQTADDSFIESLSLTVVGELFNKGDRVISVGDNADCMYFIMKGTVEVVGSDGQVHAEMGVGSFFGEVGIFFNLKRTASIRAKEDLILFKLTKSALFEVADRYPAFQHRIKEEADERHKLYLSRRSKTSDSVELFDVEVGENHLKEISLFESFEPHMLSELAMSMSRKTWERGQNIINVGERADSMFFLALGKVEIVTEFGQVIDTAQGPSSWFGEVGILQDVPRIATIRCFTECSVYELKQSDLMDMMNRYPDVKAQIEETSKERLQAHLMRSILA